MLVQQLAGRLILKSVPDTVEEKKIAALVAKHLKNINIESAFEMVKKAPVVLGDNVMEETAQFIIDSLKKLGASATYLPQGPMATQKTSNTNDAADLEARYIHKGSESSRSLRLLSKLGQRISSWKARLRQELANANKELWLILSMIAIAGVINYVVNANQMFLGFYTLPTLVSAYFYGRRHATLTAFASVLLIGLIVYYKPAIFNIPGESGSFEQGWDEIAIWGGILLITAYAMGTLYERNSARISELRRTYKGLLVILRHFISRDEYTENHCYRVSIYAAQIAAYLGFSPDRIEDLRSAALLHDIGKLDISKELLHKAAQLTYDETRMMKEHTDKGAQILEPVGASLGGVIPIILAHHEKYNGSGYHSDMGENIPLAARILSVADVYDALTSDRPYRKAITPFEAKEVIVRGANTEFDPTVVEAFLRAFRRREMEAPRVMI